ncbi:MAG: IS110 family transposase [Nitrospinae bacterium]|nr:IS110 family transposase [Nitrospinota bacterium]
MDVLFTHCAGLDVHKKTVMACRVTPDPTAQQADGLMEVKEFGTTTAALLALSDWLAEAGITHVAMESTGEYWKPVYNILEGDLTVFLVNAAHVKQVPGRKTDKADARWLAKLMRYGLLQASFIPPQGQRDLRDLTRYRTKLVQERSREVNRVQGVLERANIKLASVATDVMGVSGRAILAALVEGRADPATMAELAKGRMRSKIPLLEQALTGLVRDHHRQLLALQLAHIDFLDEQIDTLSVEIARRLLDLGAGEPPAMSVETAGTAGSAADPGAPPAPMTFIRAITVLDTIPGVDQRGAELLVAEWGIDMGCFGTADRLSAWTGVAPGNDASAGKQRSGKTRKGNRALRTGLTQLAHAAARTKGTYLSALYHRLAARRGKKRAIIAVAHSIVVSAFHMLSRNEPYHELGANYFDEHRRHQLVDRLARRIERLGYRLTLEPVAAA